MLIASYLFLSIDAISKQGMVSIDPMTKVELLEVGDSEMEYLMGNFVIQLIFIQLFLNFLNIINQTIQESRQKTMRKK